MLHDLYGAAIYIFTFTYLFTDNVYFQVTYIFTHVPIHMYDMVQLAALPAALGDLARLEVLRAVQPR